MLESFVKKYEKMPKGGASLDQMDLSVHEKLLKDQEAFYFR